MILVSKSVSTLVRKPLAIIYWALIVAALFFVFTNVYEIIASFLNGSLEGAVQESTFQTVMTLIVSGVSVVVNAINAKLLLYLLAGVVVFALISGLFFSGYNNTVYHSIDKEKDDKSGFGYGIMKFFVRNFLATLIFIVMILLLVVLFLVALMPTVTAFYYAAGNQIPLALAVAFLVVTLAVIAFISIYFIVYFTAWFPAIFSEKAHPFKLSVFVVNRNFWAIFVRYLLVIIIAVAINLAFSSVMSLCSIPMTDLTPMIISGAINVLIISFFSVYVFTLFRYFFSKTKAEMRRGR